MKGIKGKAMPRIPAILENHERFEELHSVWEKISLGWQSL